MKIISKQHFEIIKNHKDGSMDKQRVLDFIDIENTNQIIHKVEYKDFVIVFFNSKDYTTENTKLLFKTINNFYLVNECEKDKVRIKINKFNDNVLLDILKTYKYNKTWNSLYPSYVILFCNSYKIEEIPGNNNYVYILPKY